jgi:NAD(P)-dependent dehydrogenase (short-subunit alcohol dehydrogenase family)
MGRLGGKFAIVTGASRGIGRAIALELAREGAKVALNYQSNEALAEAVAAEIRAGGGECMLARANVADSGEARGLIKMVVDAWGRLDILVNNAGIAVMSDGVKANFRQMMAETLGGDRPTQSIGATRTMTDSQWRRTISVHLDGTFYCTREALAVMEPQGSGKIINMASIAGTTGLLGSPDYSAAKAGIIGLTKAVAREVIGRGISVNAIAPGFIDTPLLDMMDEPMKQMIVLQTPIGRLGTAQEVAAVALYLASADSGFTVGQVISPNGGYWM